MNNGAPQNPEKTPQVEGERYSLREYINEGGSVSWLLDGYDPDGHRTRKRFKDYNKGLLEQSKLENKAKGIIESMHWRQTRLSEEELKAAEAAMLELKPLAPEELSAAVRAYKETHAGANTTMTLRQALELCCKAKQKAGRSKHTIKSYKTAVWSFIDVFGHVVKENSNGN